MALKEQLQDDVKDAMRQGDTFKRDTLRMLLAAVKQDEIDQRTQLDDSEVQGVLAKQAKQRRESIADAQKAGREELAAQENAELQIIEEYLPQMMTADEVRPIAAGVIADTGATSMQDMGRVMGQLMPLLKGKADGRLVSDIVRELLQ